MSNFDSIALVWYQIWKPEYEKSGNIETIHLFLRHLIVNCDDSKARQFALHMLVDRSFTCDKSILTRSQIMLFNEIFHHGYSHAYDYDAWVMPDVCEECFNEILGLSQDGDYSDDIAF